jgi:hypothetical protein
VTWQKRYYEIFQQMKSLTLFGSLEGQSPRVGSLGATSKTIGSLGGLNVIFPKY